MSKSQSIKRQRVASSETKLDATSDDFEEESHQFRFHKKVKVEAALTKKKKEKLKNNLPAYELRNKSSYSKSFESKAVLIDLIEDVVITDDECRESGQSLKNSMKSKEKDVKLDDSSSFYSKEFFPSEDEHTDFVALEKSICSHSEKLCPSCKHIVESSVFASHFTTCLKKFSYSKGRKYEDNAQKEEAALPCPVCLKTLNNKSLRSTHIKSCAQLHGLNSEQLILASRLQEKQIEERLSLGLPIQQTESAKNEVDKGPAISKKDPDLEMAVALSCSLAEEEKEKREQEEDALLQLGLPILIQEKRRTNHLVLPPSTTAISQVKVGKRSRNTKQQRTALMMQSKENREQIISEKVAVILATKPAFSQLESTNLVELRGVLKHYQDKNCALWSLSHSDCPLEDTYVPELQNFIIKKEQAVGGLLKHFSQVPGRLNYTTTNVDSEDQETDDYEKQDNPETTIVNNYCTQLALAELLGSQDDLAELSFNEVTNEESMEIKSCDIKNIDIESENIEKDLSHSPREIAKIDEGSHNSTIIDSQLPEVLTDHLDEISINSDAQSQEVTNVEHCNNLLNIVDPTSESSSYLMKSSRDNSVTKCLNNFATNTSLIGKYEESKLSHLQTKLMSDWSEVLASSKWSDMMILTDHLKIPCHSLVLRARCPIIMKECFDKPNESLKYLNLNSIPHESVNKFLEYLYTGSVSIKSKDDPNWMGLFDLALKYNCKELVNYLESIYKSPTSLELSEEINFDAEVNIYQSMLTPQKMNSNTEEKSSEKQVIDVSSSPELNLLSPEPNLLSPEPNLLSPDNTSTVQSTTFEPLLGNIGMSLIRNKDDINILDGNTISSKPDCHSYSPDIFEETANSFNVIKTPILTPPQCLEFVDEIKSPNEVEIFKEDDVGHHHLARRRQLFSDSLKNLNFSEFGKVQTSNNRLDKSGSQILNQSLYEVNKISSLQISPIKDFDGDEKDVDPVVDLTMSSDDSLENMPSPFDHQIDLDDKILLDQTLPFDPPPPASRENLYVQNCTLNSLDETLHFSPCSKTDQLIESEQVALDHDVIMPKENSIAGSIAIVNEEDNNNSSKSSNHLQSINLKTNLSTKNDSDLSPKLMNSSHIVELVSPSAKNGSYVSKLWDNFESEGDFYFECPSKETSPTKLYENVPETIINKSTDKFKLPVNKHDLDGNETSNTSERLYPVLDASDVNEKVNSFSDVGNDTLLFAVAEVETQLSSNSSKPVIENTPKTKKSKLYKSKSCTLVNTKPRPAEARREMFFSSPVKTPISIKKWGPLNITPMPDYKTMVSPELKKELDRFGIRKLSRKKAITLLTHIYDQLHPFVSDSEVDSSYLDTPDKVAPSSKRTFNGKNRAPPPSKKRYTAKQKSPPKNRSSQEELNNSRSSITSTEGSDDENSCLEETAFLVDDDDGEDQEEISLTQQSSFETQIKDLIKFDVTLHEKILLYEPIWANELLASAKANGIKCNMKTLLDFLDRQCITFRLPTTRNRKKNNKKSPTKKSRCKKGLTQDNIT